MYMYSIIYKTILPTRFVWLSKIITHKLIIPYSPNARNVLTICSILLLKMKTIIKITFYDIVLQLIIYIKWVQV